MDPPLVLQATPAMVSPRGVGMQGQEEEEEEGEHLNMALVIAALGVTRQCILLRRLLELAV